MKSISTFSALAISLVLTASGGIEQTTLDSAPLGVRWGSGILEITSPTPVLAHFTNKLWLSCALSAYWINRTP